MSGSLTALRALLCLVITFLLAGTRAEAFFDPGQPAPGQNAPLHSEATGQNYDGSQYDALDSLIAAKRGFIPALDCDDLSSLSPPKLAEVYLLLLLLTSDSHSWSGVQSSARFKFT